MPMTRAASSAPRMVTLTPLTMNWAIQITSALTRKPTIPRPKGVVFAENAFNHPAEQSYNQRKHKSAPESPDCELRDNPADHHQNDCSDHETYHMT